MTQPINRDTVLDATRQCILTNGPQNVTLTMIAAAAGVSRMTVYRKWDSLNRVIIETTEREIHGCLTQAINNASSGYARQRCVDMMISAIELLQENPVIRAVLEQNYDIFRAYLIERTGQTQTNFINLVSQYLGAGIKDGSIGLRDITTSAYMMLFTLQNFVSAHSIFEKETNYRAVLTELRSMLDAYLRQGAIK